MFGALFGPGSSSCFMPAHIQEIDGIVCRSGPEYRGVLVQFYTRGGTIREKAFVLGIPKSTLKSRLDRAEWYVNTELDGVGQDAL
jgi:DNA-directed RNA polymerase specialized sigma24 family protein